MANGDFGRADLLRRFKLEAGLADASELDDNNDLYPLLSDGQLQTTRELAARAPKPFYQAPVQMVTADGGFTFSFGASPVDPTKNVLPMGWVQISPRQNAFSGDSFVGWKEGREFINEGTKIRIAGNRSWSGVLWTRFVATPPPITAAVDPILHPPEVNELTVYRAVELWAGQGNVRPDLIERMQDKWARAFPVWCLTFKKMHPGNGYAYDPARWWLWAGGDLGGKLGFGAA